MENLQELSNLNLQELYAYLDRLYKTDGLGIKLNDTTGDSKGGHSRFVSIFNRIKGRLCNSPQIKFIINENKHYNRIELAVVLSEVISANFTELHFSAIPLAFIITHHSLFEICK